MNEEKIEAAVSEGFNKLVHNTGPNLEVVTNYEPPKSRRWSKNKTITRYPTPYNIPEVYLDNSCVTTGDNRWNIIVRILMRLERHKEMLGGDTWVGGNQAFYSAASDAIIAALDEYASDNDK